MLRDFKFLRRKQNGVGVEASDEIENVPTNSRDSLASQSSYESLTRPPLNTINDPNPGSKPEIPDLGNRKTPTNPKLPIRTPTKSYQRFGWGQRGEESREEGREYGRVGLVTPRSMRNLGKANSGYSESNSTQSTPTKSVSKPVGSGIRGRVGNLHRGIPVSGVPSGTVVNTVEVPHFDLKEDPSFWMEHSVQVLIRVRPPNSMEKSSMNGYNRCLKQESAQSITWIGQPETRFTFDHVACETVDQEMLFRVACLPMVENCLSGYNSCMFAYGQTGSGKTYTMLGEIDDLEVKPSPHRGMTPRIFEFLFARIQAEEESRRDERLKYNCKCSFLEIYNEQITDLLDPSSTNLLLREDAKKGVYVENLSEFEVQTVSDILKLLTQGSLNRKVAATNMNRESSRSHSVFTCVIECRWENNATTNLRFARLNLVDLAGSERQKSSGAEGERLKEAANINKSLSILGHVIMILMDVAQGRPRHVPYRDSKLTFLLQDSLGGNSKTMIIANVSPSICCAAETLNTLKFAQRAKLIQNNAVVNEDSSGDVTALQHQIRLLKEELAVLKRQNVSRSLSFGSIARSSMQDEDIGFSKPTQETNVGPVDDLVGIDSKGIVRMSTKQWKSLEMTLAGALRREQMAEGSIKKLEAEIEHLNRLVRQREEDTRGTKMMLRFREDRIQRMESLVGGLLPSDAFLLEENRALTEEIQQLQAKMDKNPEVTRFALEYIRLLDQLRRFQEFYEEGEREILLDEVSGLRDQLLQFLDGKCTMPKNSDGHVEVTEHVDQEDKSLHLELKSTLNELENCRNKLTTCLEENQKLTRELHDACCMLDKLKYAENHQGGNIETEKDFSVAAISEHGIFDGDQNDFEGVHGTFRPKHVDKILVLQLELDILKIILKEERSARAEVETNAMSMNHDLDTIRKNFQVVSKQYKDALNELKESKSVVEALESQQIVAINEIEDLKKYNCRCKQMFGEKGLEVLSSKEQFARKASRDAETCPLKDEDSILQRKLRRMQDSLETAKRLNVWYQSDRALCESNEEEMDEVRRQVEAETAEVIVCMQDELSFLQKQVEDSHLKEMETEKATALMEIKLKELEDELHLLSEDNNRLSETLMRKDEDLGKLSEEWELLSCEMEEMLLNGQMALDDAADQLDLISSSFPQKRIWISEQVGRLIRTISEKELLIEELGNLLEDANVKRNEVECMVKSLRGAALVINEANHQEFIKKDNEILLLKSQLNAKTSTILELEEKVKNAEHKLEEIETNNISEIREKFAELRAGICSFRSFMDIPSKNDSIAANDEMHATFLPDDWNNLETDAREDLIADIAVHYPLGENGLCSFSTIQKDDGLSACKNVVCRDVSVILLKKEIESAINSLQEVHMEMNKLQKKKEETQISEKEHRQGMDLFITQMLGLQTAISDFEERVEVKINTINNKLKTFEQTVVQTETCWCLTKEFLEMDAYDSKIAAVQKAAEASCILAKFEEAQHTMKEADIMINELLIANETMKLNVEKLKEKENSLATERNKLTAEVESLQAINVIKDKQFEEVKEQFGSDLRETRNLVMELEEIIAEVQVTFKENLLSFVSDFDCLKTLVANNGKLMHSWLEDVWSDIIVKDSALSVLHLCHMGIFLETITGLNAENSFLQHGLSESNSIIADLREHNSKSSKELQICRTLKGKLLADIKNSFDRIARKEEETGKLDVKLITFEKKISDLQLQEELMLQRSNYMASQHAGLIKELDLSSKNVVVSLFDQEKMLKDKEESFDSQAELFMREVCSKDIELFIITSQLNEMAHQNVLAQRERDCYGSYFESVKEELTMYKVDAELKEKELVAMKAECDKLLKDLKAKDDALKESSGRVIVIDQENIKLQKHIQQLEVSSSKIQNDLDMKNAEIDKISYLEEENKLLKSDLVRLKNERCSVFQDLEMKNSEVESFLCRINLSDAENQRLQGRISSLETLISSLQTELKMKNAKLSELVHSRTVVMADILAKSQDLENFVAQLHKLKDENELLRNSVHKIHANTSLNSVKCVDSLQKADGVTDRLVGVLKEKHLSVTDMYYAFFESVERTSEFVKEIEFLECHVVELAKENTSLHAELLRKDDILKGLLFDLSLLQESASSAKDQKDKIEEMMGNMDALEDELSMKSSELEEALSHRQILEAQLQDKIDMISALEMDYAKMCESLNIYSQENLEMKAKMEKAFAANASLEEELTEKKNLADSLEIQLSQLHITLCQMSNTRESLRSDWDSISIEREQLQMEIHSLKDQLKKAHTLAEENEAIAQESQQEAESRKIYAEDKETEVKLLEKSVEELECTVNVLENKVDILKHEAERQRLQREELEMELHAINHQMQNVESSDFDMKRHLEQKEKDLEQAMKHVQFLERDIADKNKEISQCKAHISELNLHAEAQASEFKQKFKALEAMAEQANPENPLSHIANPSWNKSDKVYAKPRGSSSPFDKSDKAYGKPRGSGSPFKCIGLGLAQQMKSEKEEEFAAARMHIEELESLAASRQKEIFALNARLAAAESMTHDVIRDLLGVKLDMTNCVTILDHHQVQKIAEKVHLGTLEPQVKEQEVNKLRQQLNEFIEERHGWLEEIDRKQAELVAAQVALEKLRQREQLLSAENEMLKMENVNHKKRVMELEGEVKKLSGQQNLQQRIHHHAKIKDENNSLRRQNEDLTAKLHRTEVIISRIKDELARYRASNGRAPCINFDEEQQLVNRLKESEEDRVQLAQKLLGLCTNILKVAGITKPISSVTPAVAEEALEQLKNRIASLERELQDAIHKDRINSERIRLSEFLPQTSPINSRTDDNRRTPRRSQSPFFSALER